MKLDLWGIHSIMVIEWYYLTFELILMILAIAEVLKNEENGFSSNFQFFRGAIGEKFMKSKKKF